MKILHYMICKKNMHKNTVLCLPAALQLVKPWLVVLGDGVLPIARLLAIAPAATVPAGLAAGRF